MAQLARLVIVPRVGSPFDADSEAAQKVLREIGVEGGFTHVDADGAVPERGVIVSTGLGSSGWLKSIYAGWSATTRVLLPADALQAPSPAFPWDAERLHFAVREPFPSRTTRASLVFGRLEAPATLTLVSQMPENGVIFSDGIEADFLDFNSGVRAEIGVADKRGHLVV